MLRLTGLLLLASSAFCADKIAIIDMQKALISSKEGIQAADDLRRKYTGPQSDAESIKREVLALRIRLADDGLSDEERDKLRRQVSEKSRAMEQGSRDELERERTQILNALAKKLNAIVDAYAKEKKYDTVIDISNPNGPVIYFKKTADITDEIIKRFDAMSKP